MINRVLIGTGYTEFRNGQYVESTGRMVGVGDWVEFKSDYEQSGRVVEIRCDNSNRVTLVLENPDGFGGDYLRYATHTEVSPGDCW